MRHYKIPLFFFAVVLTLSSCGVFGGSDGTDVATADEFEAEPTVNSVQSVPAETAVQAEVAQPADGSANAALPTAVTLPTAAPTPEPTVDRSQPTTYIVQSGDVLGLIAERFDADIAELRRENGLDGNLIRVGQELTIPALEGAASTTESAAGAPVATIAPISPSTTTSTTTTTSSAPVSCNSAATGHCVQPGESLLGIALKYDVSVEALRSANAGISGDLIKSGEVLNLPGGNTTTAPVTTTTTTTTSTATGTTAVEPAPTVGPTGDADCKLRNAAFPYFHAADGLCYANPIGPTVVPTSSAASTNVTDTECPAGRILWSDGLCYVFGTPVPTVEPTASNTTSTTQEDYGRPPCRDGYVVLISVNKCWPEETTVAATVTPTP